MEILGDRIDIDRIGTKKFVNVLANKFGIGDPAKAIDNSVN